MSRTIASLLFLLFTIHGVQAQDNDPIVIGTKHSVASEVLGENREYWVSLPESYHQPASSHKKYPLLIVLDGRSHFRSISGAVNYMSFGYNRNRKIPEMIIVAVRNVNRERDFTPDKIITRRKNNTGGADKFLAFLDGELIPQIEQEYRTMPYRILFGHSLAGLFATHAYMKKDAPFNALIAVDPSFGTWDAQKMDAKLDTLTDQSFKRYLYIATANWGKRNIRNRDRHIRLYESLNRKYEGELPARLEYFENENHGSVPLIAFHNGISAIFEGYGISDRDVDSKARLLEHFQELSERLSYNFSPPEALVNRIAYRLLRSRNETDHAKALEFFVLNAENYPESFNAFDSLGEAYEALGDKTKAISSYEKALKLSPDNGRISGKIERLRK